MLPVPEQAHATAERLEYIHRRHCEVLLQYHELAAGIQLDYVAGEGTDVDDVANDAQRGHLVRMFPFLRRSETDLFRSHGDRLAVPRDRQGGITGEDVRRPDKTGNEAGRRPLIYLGRTADLLDPPLIHHRHAVAHRQRFLLVVRHINKCHREPLLDRLQLDLHRLAKLEIEGAKRFVEQEHPGLVDERARQRHALPLPTRELARLAPIEAVEPHHGQRLADAPAALGATNALDRKSTRLNSSHGSSSYAVFCLKKKKSGLPTHRSVVTRGDTS